MQVTLDALTQTATFRLHGIDQVLPFAQLGEILIHDVPDRGVVATWIAIGSGLTAGVTSAGLLRLRHVLPPVTVDLPIADYQNLGSFSEGDDHDQAWDTLIERGVIVPVPRNPANGISHSIVLVRGMVPARTWEIEYAPDGLIRQTLLFHGIANDRTREPWRLGNVNTDGSICWGTTPPTWNPATSIHDIDFFMLTGSAFNTDWQHTEFQWSCPHVWRVVNGIVRFGEVRTIAPDGTIAEGWTFNGGLNDGTRAEMVEEKTTEGTDDGE